MQNAHAAAAANDLVRLDRRRYPRLHLVGEFDGQIVPFHIGARVLDISAGGFAALSLFEFPRGTTHDFQFATLQRPRPLVRAVSLYTRRVRPRRGRELLIAGFAFVDLSSAARDAIDEIVAGVAWIRAAKPAVIVPAAELPSLDASIKYK